MSDHIEDLLNKIRERQSEDDSKRYRKKDSLQKKIEQKEKIEYLLSNPKEDLHLDERTRLQQVLTSIKFDSEVSKYEQTKKMEDELNTIKMLEQTEITCKGTSLEWNVGEYGYEEVSSPRKEKRIHRKYERKYGPRKEELNAKIKQLETELNIDRSHNPSYSAPSYTFSGNAKSVKIDGDVILGLIIAAPFIGSYYLIKYSAIGLYKGTSYIVKLLKQ